MRYTLLLHGRLGGWDQLYTSGSGGNVRYTPHHQGIISTIVAAAALVAAALAPAALTAALTATLFVAALSASLLRLEPAVRCGSEYHEDEQHGHAQPQLERVWPDVLPACREVCQVAELAAEQHWRQRVQGRLPRARSEARAPHAATARTRRTSTSAAAKKIRKQQREADEHRRLERVRAHSPLEASQPAVVSHEPRDEGLGLLRDGKAADRPQRLAHNADQHRLMRAVIGGDIGALGAGTGAATTASTLSSASKRRGPSF
eukprot:scaffold7576_cov61-Phaeocystis_antarctica.AAC.2